MMWDKAKIDKAREIANENLHKEGPRHTCADWLLGALDELTETQWLLKRALLLSCTDDNDKYWHDPALAIEDAIAERKNV